MAYCSTEDVRRVLVGGRGQDENLNANSLDEDQLEDAITDSCVQIDSVLRNRYVVPITVLGVVPVHPPAIIHTLATNIAVYNAYLIYRQDREFASPLAAVILRYQRAVSLLARIDKKEITLEIDTLDTLYGTDGTTVFNPYDGPMFPSSNVFNAQEGYIPPDRVWR